MRAIRYNGRLYVFNTTIAEDRFWKTVGQLPNETAGGEIIWGQE